jgi:hypothetical protein
MIPILIVAFNRPEKLKILLESLSASKPPVVMLAVDGPREGVTSDLLLVEDTQKLVESIDWNCVIETRFRDRNLGLRSAYVDAVDWAMSRYGSAVIVEDDVIAGPQFYQYVATGLAHFQKEKNIAQINGYNHVPTAALVSPDNSSRLSIYPTSYAWGTWNHAWAKYDPKMEWGMNVSLAELRKTTTGSSVSAAKWKMNFKNAYYERVNTWDYFWVSSIWEQGWMSVTPNRNLVQYNGFDDGTHTRIKRKNKQPPLEFLSLQNSLGTPIYDEQSDKWISKNVHKDVALGLVETASASLVLGIIKKRKDRS